MQHSSETHEHSTPRPTDLPEQGTKRSSRKASHKSSDSKEAHASKPAAKKAKPSFELPVEADASESAAGWVFRDSETAAVIAKDHVATNYVSTDRAPEHRVEENIITISIAPPTQEEAAPNSLSMLAMATEAMVLGATSIGFAVLAMVRLMEVTATAGEIGRAHV